MTRTYPELQALAHQVPVPVVLDGELVVLDEAGVPSFRLHQNRMQLRSPRPQLVTRWPVQYYAFDLLYTGSDETALLDEPYEQRRAVLDEVLAATATPLRVPPYYVDVAGDELLAVARENHLEGVVAKRLSSRYTPGQRSRNWVKTPLRTTIEVVVCGATPGQGQHAATFGSLVLGVHDLANGRLRYVGNVGSGFTEQDRRTLRSMLDERSRADAPFDERPPAAEVAGARWVTPELVGDVAYREWIRPEHRLRHPSWRGPRMDVSAAQVTAVFDERPSG
jgi:bifunctional non-homologous end joining protein LigD